MEKAQNNVDDQLDGGECHHQRLIQTHSCLLVCGNPALRPVEFRGNPPQSRVLRQYTIHLKRLQGAWCAPFPHESTLRIASRRTARVPPPFNMYAVPAQYVRRSVTRIVGVLSIVMFRECACAVTDPCIAPGLLCYRFEQIVSCLSCPTRRRAAPCQAPAADVSPLACGCNATA